MEKQEKIHESGTRSFFYKKIYGAIKTVGVKNDSDMSGFLQLQGSSLLLAIEKLSEKHARFGE